MKKVLVVMALCVPFAAMLAAGMPVVSPAKAVEPPTAPFLTMPDEFELVNDEATPVEFGFKMQAGDRLAVMFTPPNYPFEITEACYVPMGWADDPDNWDEDCYLVFFGPGAEPGTELGRKEVAGIAQFEFNWFDVSDLNIEITSGSFYFGVENKVNDNPGIALDGAAPLHHVSWMYAVFVGEVDPKWAPFDNIGLPPPWPDELALGDSVDAILRVRGTAAPIGVVELKPDVVEFTPSASIVSSGGTVNYTLAEGGDVVITLWDALGREVRNLYSGHADAGDHTLIWDGSDLGSGTYFIKLRTPYAVKTTRVVLIH